MVDNMIIRLILFCLPYIVAVNGGMCSIPFISPPSCCHCGDLTINSPKYLFIGEYLDMTCSLNSETVNKGDNSTDLVFIFGDDDKLENDMIIESEATVRLYKQMTTLDNDGSYFCKLRKEGKNLIEGESIEVEYPPHTVQNFTCIFINWDEYMQCNWDLGVPYKHKAVINISLYMEDGYCSSINTTWCTWNKNEGIKFDREFYNFTVKVTNKKRQVSKLTENLIINYIDNVKPSKADYLEVEPESSTCLTLRWSHSRTDKHKEFIITSTSKWNDTMVFHATNFNKTICNLIPNTRYDVSIETVPGKNLGYPSDMVQNSTFTLKDKPHPPEIVDNKYFVQDEDCINKQRTISIQWKEVPERHHNGLLIGYFVAVTKADGSLYAEKHINDTSQLQYTVQIPCDPMTVSLKSWGEEGLSTDSSLVTIPEAKYLTVGHIVLITIAGLVCLILAIVGLKRSNKKICKACKAIQKPYEISTIPVTKTQEYEEFKQLNKDSGNSSLSTNPSCSSEEKIKINNDFPEMSDIKGGISNEVFYNEEEKLNRQISDHLSSKDDAISKLTSTNDKKKMSSSDTENTMCDSMRQSYHSEQDLSKNDVFSNSDTKSLDSSSWNSEDEKLVVDIDDVEDNYMGVQENLPSYVQQGSSDSCSTSPRNSGSDSS